MDCGLAEISIGALLTCELEGARCSWDKDSRAHISLYSGRCDAVEATEVVAFLIEH